MEKDELWTFLEESSALLSVFLLVAMIMTWALDGYWAVGSPATTAFQ
jgi:hypothetical protein